MHKVISLLLLSFLAHNTVDAQIFGEKVTIFDIKYKAKEVTGQKRFDATDFLYRTRILSPLQTRKRDEIFYSIGSYRKDKNLFEATDLFNLSFQRAPHPFLDLIDFDYYRNVGFNLVERDYPDIVKNADYVKLKAYIVDSTHLSIQNRKSMLFSFPIELRNKIISSRYEVITNTFNVDKKKISKTTAELKAQLDTIKINASSEISAKVRAYLSRLADEATIIKGYYIDIRLHPSYISKIDYYIGKAIKVELGDDQFATNLKKYVESETAAANSGLVAMQLEGKFNKTKVNIDSIEADLSSKFQISTDELKKISASVNLTFTRNEKIIFSNEFNNAFVIRYFTSKTIDELNFKSLGFTYDDAVVHGRNMGILIRELENYYKSNNEFPKSLGLLNINDVISSLGDSKLEYRLISAKRARLAFAGADYELNTSDDKIYEGADGKFLQVKKP